MARIDWTPLMKTGRRLAAAAPAALAAFGVAMAASSTPRPEIDRRAELVRQLTGGDLSGKGFAAITARMDPSQLALAMRHDPSLRQPALYGLTPGWDSLTLAGKPGLDFGATGLDAIKLNAATPSASGLLRAAKPFVFSPVTVADRRRAQRCLTQAIYYEAALEPTEGQEAVAQVILNRVRDPNYANTVCGVVFEGAERTTGCQFSFTCDGSLAQGPVRWAWDRASRVAERALAGHVATRRAVLGSATRRSHSSLSGRDTEVPAADGRGCRGMVRPWRRPSPRGSPPRSPEESPCRPFRSGRSHAHTWGMEELDPKRSEERRVGKECRSRWSPYH